MKAPSHVNSISSMCQADYAMVDSARADRPFIWVKQKASIRRTFWRISVDSRLWWYIIYLTCESVVMEDCREASRGREGRVSEDAPGPAPPSPEGARRKLPANHILRSARLDAGSLRDAAAPPGRRTVSPKPHGPSASVGSSSICWPRHSRPRDCLDLDLENEDPNAPTSAQRRSWISCRRVERNRQRSAGTTWRRRSPRPSGFACTLVRCSARWPEEKKTTRPRHRRSLERTGGWLRARGPVRRTSRFRGGISRSPGNAPERVYAVSSTRHARLDRPGQRFLSGTYTAAGPQ